MLETGSTGEASDSISPDITPYRFQLATLIEPITPLKNDNTPSRQIARGWNRPQAYTRSINHRTGLAITNQIRNDTTHQGRAAGLPINRNRINNKNAQDTNNN